MSENTIDQILAALRQLFVDELGRRDAYNVEMASNLERVLAENDGLRARVLTLEAELEELGARTLIQVSPAISVKVGDLGTFRPGLEGEKQGRETRYAGRLESGIGVLVDVKDDGQVAVAVERFTDGPAIEAGLEVKIGTDTAMTPMRLHHHCRPRVVFRASKPPAVDLAGLVAAGKIPNYLNAVPPNEDALKKIALGQHPWTRLSGPAPLGEDYGQLVNSWVGGAGPLLNEAGHLMPVQVVYLTTQDPRAWTEVVRLANSSGNYAVHYQTADGRVPLPAETEAMPYLNDPDTVMLKSAAGTGLPIPDVAHQHSLTYLARLLTGERYYAEELEYWNLFNVMCRPYGELRERGILWSGQVRSAAWSLRTLLHCVQIHGPGRYEFQLVDNLRWMAETFADLASPEHRPTGVCSVNGFRSSPFLDYVAPGTRPPYIATWNHHILVSVLNECMRAGFPEARPMRDHVLRVAGGLWEASPSGYLYVWGQHAYPADDWTAVVQATFPMGTWKNDLTTFPAPPVTPDNVGWARAPIVAGVDAGEAWAGPALAWLDEAAARFKGGLPLVWQIAPGGRS